MKRTVYLPDELKADLRRAAHSEDRSEAQLIREGVRLVVGRAPSPPPRIPLFASDDPTLDEPVDV
jgi:hypothetical protein